MPRRTKIVATLGPATDDSAVLDDMIAAGVDVVRLNLSHDTHERLRAGARSASSSTVPARLTWLLSVMPGR